MNKKLLFGCLTIVLLISGFLIADRSMVNEGRIEAENVLFENAEEAAAASDLVLEVRATERSTSIEEGENGFGIGHTLTDVEVLNVLENKTNEDPDSMLTVAEPFVESERIIGKEVTTYGNYTPLKHDDTYILFLDWGENIQNYWINSLEQGQIPLDKQESEYATTEQYESLITSVKEAYSVD
ncbi:hypothetical protein [Alkalicoccus urumqiensis]|uniref:Uncharacterized protein n=1 Tax=Alkalicoccus urumqiensis TaxID=1548213 RepID=A0A2P6MDY1_ALKUR|nr:hypothetical protein [Alkalicoccus urumqiensis]PRO64488.1 hypothetical protein C6I21_14265 [Alkalicoccus urumqiensis]